MLAYFPHCLSFSPSLCKKEHDIYASCRMTCTSGAWRHTWKGPISVNASLLFLWRSPVLKLPRMAPRGPGPGAGSGLISVDITCTFISLGALQKSLVKIKGTVTSALLRNQVYLFMWPSPSLSDQTKTRPLKYAHLNKSNHPNMRFITMFSRF